MRKFKEKYFEYILMFSLFLNVAFIFKNIPFLEIYLKNGTFVSICALLFSILSFRESISITREHFERDLHFKINQKQIDEIKKYSSQIISISNQSLGALNSIPDHLIKMKAIDSNKFNNTIIEGKIYNYYETISKLSREIYEKTEILNITVLRDEEEQDFLSSLEKAAYSVQKCSLILEDQGNLFNLDINMIKSFQNKVDEHYKDSEDLINEFIKETKKLVKKLNKEVYDHNHRGTHEANGIHCGIQ
ncbi:hypothetical protein [Facklamia sp. P9177]|uniref:hypothetical protein n=1 Tax=Facklamia sp. P9177 TaxID=3421945 RepID=UPI003D17D1BE